MNPISSRSRRKARVPVVLSTALASVWAVAGLAPAEAASIWYTGDKSVTCSNGKAGYLFAEGGHVSRKMVYHKKNGEMHWSNTTWTGYNGGDVLIRILPKSGGNRTARAYMALKPNSKGEMSPRSKLSWYLFCDSRDLIGDNYGDSLTRLTSVWRSTYWKVFR